MIDRIGFIGTGTITASVVDGLAGSTPRPAGIWLSPRNAAVATRLAASHDNVRVARDNQQVLDECDVVCLAVRPQIFEEVIASLRFGPHHRVLSFVATYRLERLKALLGDVHSIARLTPLPMVAQREGKTVVFPKHDDADALFAALGGTLDVDSEDAFDAASAATATMGAFFALLARQTAWLADHGIAKEAARAYIAAMYSGLAHAGESSTETFDALVHEYSTRGGLNEQMVNHLKDQQVFDALGSGLDRVLSRIQGKPQG